MHYEIDFDTWDTPDQLHKKSTLYIQRGNDGYAKREELKVPESDMFRAELEMFAESCVRGKANELSAQNGNVAGGMGYAAEKSLGLNGGDGAVAGVLMGRTERVPGGRAE